MRGRRLRIVIPAYPAFNIDSHVTDRTTVLGLVCVASAVNDRSGCDAEVIDEDNLGRYGLGGDIDGADHGVLQSWRPADVVRFYGGLTSAIPRLYDVARTAKSKESSPLQEASTSLAIMSHRPFAPALTTSCSARPSRLSANSSWPTGLGRRR